MTASNMERTFITDMEDKMEAFYKLVNDARMLEKRWNAHAFGTEITAQDLTDENRDYDTAELAATVTLLQDLIKFATNVAVATGDRETVAAKLLGAR